MKLLLQFNPDTFCTRRISGQQTRRREQRRFSSVVETMPRSLWISPKTFFHGEVESLYPGLTPYQISVLYHIKTMLEKIIRANNLTDIFVTLRNIDSNNDTMTIEVDDALNKGYVYESYSSGLKLSI